MKYQVHLLETIGDYAQTDWIEVFDTLGQAEHRVESLKQHEYGKLGQDWYIEVLGDIKEIQE